MKYRCSLIKSFVCSIVFITFLQTSCKIDSDNDQYKILLEDILGKSIETVNNQYYILLSTRGCIGCIGILENGLLDLSNENITIIVSNRLRGKKYLKKLERNIKLVYSNENIEKYKLVKSSIIAIQVQEGEVHDFIIVSPENVNELIEEIKSYSTLSHPV